MTEEQIEEVLKNHLPEWAIRLHGDGELEMGAQLPTRDGRRRGNAHIIGIQDNKYVQGELLYLVLTDAGNTMRMSRAEVEEAFYPPKYVSDVADVMNKFWCGH